MRDPYLDRAGKTLWQGHVLDVLAEMPERSVQLVVTSPPYYGLRAYGTEAQVWGGDPTCEHGWQMAVSPGMTGGHGDNSPAQSSARRIGAMFDARHHATCPFCGAWRGELGAEPTPQLFVEHLRGIFAAVWRVLRDDGVLVVNLTDSYNGSGKGPTGHNGVGAHSKRQGFEDRLTNDPGVPRKSRLAVPERFVLAMLDAPRWTYRDDMLLDPGWLYDDDRGWCKRAPMPESAQDRPTQAWEHLYVFTKQARYFWDQEAVKEPAAESSQERAYLGERPLSVRQEAMQSNGMHGDSHTLRVYDRPTRHPRNYMLLGPSPYPGAHFATFPPAVPEFFIKAATSAVGCCAECGAPWARTVERVKTNKSDEARIAKYEALGVPRTSANLYERGDVTPPPAKTLGWRPTCRHADAERVPCTVLDIFAGSGTTLEVAHAHGRRGWGIELSEEYLGYAEARLMQDALPLEASLAPPVTPSEQIGLFGEVEA